MSRYIDADKLKHHYSWWDNDFSVNYSTGEGSVKKLFDDIIDQQPTADVRENVKGYWKKRKDKPLQNWYQCSNCGAICGETPKYCSECGADMRGEA